MTAGSPLENLPMLLRARRACAWPPRTRQGPARLIDPEEFRSWIVHEDDEFLVLNKPGDVVCHPSKAGPRSSLVGAAREYANLPVLHLAFRLDRETSGLVILTKQSETASRLQRSLQKHPAGKRYLAILTGLLAGSVVVDQPLGDDIRSAVFIKSAVSPTGKPSVTRFEPLAGTANFTLARATTETGRKHQIRVHAHWLGHPLVGDKIYGPDERLYLDFIDHGWSAELGARLLLPRQALHCAEIDLRPAGWKHRFEAPFPEDLRRFCRRHELEFDFDAGS